MTEFLSQVLEQSAQVEAVLAARARAREAREAAAVEDIVVEAREKILSLIAPFPVYSDPHEWSPYPARIGCIRCPYPEEHAVHERP